MKLVIPGRPVPAVRMTQRSKFISKQAQRYLEYKNIIGWTAKVAGFRPKHSLYEVAATAYIDLRKRDMDVDNLAKSLIDGLNGIVWHDDRQVVKLSIEKVYVDDAREQKAVIEIKEVS